MKNLSIFGTSSDAGKSTLTFVISKILQAHGLTVAPFKAQNVSNNAYVCDDGSEIGVAQHFQATALGIPTSYHLNPILLKSGSGNSASVIVEGKVLAAKEVLSYYQELDLLKPAVDRCFQYLDQRYDCVVCEGAGSSVELNLMDKDLSNIYIADQYETKIILVADIEKGGVFASIYGTYHLLPKALQKNLIGVIINKFRGDLSLFDEGISIIEKQFKIPVLGVLPYLPFNLGFEDSQSLKNYAQDLHNTLIKVAVIAYPTMSNYNDFEPLIADPNIELIFIDSAVGLEQFDMIILPGSKLVIKDLQWMKANGLYEAVKCYKKLIFGICGGYEMLFKTLHDPHRLENALVTREAGLGFIDDEIIFEPHKTLKKGAYKIFGCEIEGFEIHHGVSKYHTLAFESGHIKGTFIHAIFDNDDVRNQLFKSINHNYKGFNYRKYKQDKINEFVSIMQEKLDIQRIIDGIKGNS